MSRSGNQIGSVCLGLIAALLLCPFAATGKEATWTGDPWGPMTRAQMVELANEMIDSTWTPLNTIHNYRSPTQPRTTFEAGVTYRGVAYNMVYEADNWVGFLGKVNTTPGGDTDYGNDCSAFISICWRLPRRLNTVRFENEVTGPAELCYSLGDIGSGASVELLRGDVLNRSGSHNIMFDHYSNTGVISMEQTPGPRTTTLPHPEMRRNWSWSSLSNYRPIRRNLIDEIELPPMFREGEWAETTPSSLNFRPAPGTNNTPIRSLPQGTVVRIQFHEDNGIRIGSNNWWHVLVPEDGETGWVAEYFIRSTYAPPAANWADVVVDNGGAGFTASGNWETGDSVVNQYGNDFRYRTTEAVSDPAVWTGELPYPGRYRVYAWWGRAAEPSSSAPYLVAHAHGDTTVRMDQRVDGGQWNKLGVFEFPRGEARVRLSCWTGEGEIVLADAVRFLALDERPEFFHTYDRWELVHFSPEERESAEFSGPGGDPFGRGITNLAAYALDLNPRNPDRTALPRLAHEGGELHFIFRRLREDSDLVYQVDISSDLLSWNPLSGEESLIEVVDDSDSTVQLVRLTLPIEEGTTSRFARLSIERLAD